MFNVELQPTEYAIARSVAYRMAHSWTAVDAQDVQQHLLLWMVEHYDRVKAFRELEPNYQKAMLNVALRRVAAPYCAGEQEKAFGAPLVDGYSYSIPLIKEALTLMFHTPEMNQARVDPVSEAPLDSPVDHSLSQAVLVDIRGAYEAMPETFKEVLAYHFDYDLPLETIGKLYGISRSAAKKRIDRALRRIQARLG